MKLIKLKDQKINILMIIIYRIMLDWSYVYIILPVFGNGGCFPQSYSLGSYILSWCILFFFIPLIIDKYKAKTFSANVIVCFSFLSLIPTICLLGHTSLSNDYYLLISIYWFMFFLFDHLLPKFKIGNNLGQNKKVFLFMLFLFFFVVVYISGVYAHFRFHFSLFDVYDLRSEEKGFGIPLILQYIHGPSKIFLPVALCYMLHSKKYLFACFITIIILLNFGIGGHKSVLFSLFIALIGFYWYRYSRIRFVVWGLIGICAISIALYLFSNNIKVSSLFIHRVIFVPSGLNYCYHDFFSNNECDFFKEGFLRWFGFVSEYKRGIAITVGEKYFGYTLMANNGLFSDAYMNLGRIGVILFPLILNFILRLCDACTYRLNERLLFIVMVSASFSLISTSFTTTLLTFGLIVLMIALYFVPRNDI